MNLKYTIGDLFFNEGGIVRDEHGVFIKEFGIMYDFDIGEWPADEPIVKIYWQTTQKITTYYLSTVKDRVDTIQTWFHYPVGIQ